MTWRSTTRAEHRPAGRYPEVTGPFTLTDQEVDAQLFRGANRTYFRIRNRGTELLEDVWAYGEQGDPNVVEVGILRLRGKIEQHPSAPVYLRTVRGIGYQLSVPDPPIAKDQEQDETS